MQMFFFWGFKLLDNFDQFKDNDPITIFGQFQDDNMEWWLPANESVLWWLSCLENFLSLSRQWDEYAWMCN